MSEGTLAARLVNTSAFDRRSVSGEPRAGFCAMGLCGECRITDASGHVRLACLSPTDVGHTHTATETDAKAQRSITVDTAIVGAGVAGLHLARALAASASAGSKIILIDDGQCAGGRVDSGRGANPSRAAGVIAGELAGYPQATLLTQARVIDATATHLRVETPDETLSIHCRCLVIATGARELVLPRAGWTATHVWAAGGLQLMIKQGMRIDGKEIVLAGSGPLLLAAAQTALQYGARRVHVVERQTLSSLLRFAFGLGRYPDRALQSIRMLLPLVTGKLRLYCACEVHDVTNAQAVAVTAANGRSTVISSQLVGLSDGLVANIELAQRVGCRTAPRDPESPHSVVITNAAMETSVAGVYAIGEVTGIGGRARALAQAATLAAHLQARDERKQPQQREKPHEHEQPGEALRVRLARLNAEERYRASLARHFPLPADVVIEDETIVCRCEDVRWRELKETSNWRAAKLETRCGMGYCQGRYCRPVLAVLRGRQWAYGESDQAGVGQSAQLHEVPRAPIHPCRLSTLTEQGSLQ